MKAQKKSRGLHLGKTNDRWKWMAGATAATAAGVTASQAGMITVTLSNNYISSSAGNHLNPDLTGNGHADVVVNSAGFTSITSGPQDSRFAEALAFVRLNGVLANAAFAGLNNYNEATVGAIRQGGSFSAASVTGNIPISFVGDPDINQGATTPGTLEVTASAEGRFAEVQLDSYTYNNTVPDQGSSLALLAMGAGGVIALRRRRKADAKS